MPSRFQVPVPKLSRDLILFIVGLAGITYETVVEHGDKPTLLVLFGAMIGLPAFLKVDEDHKAATPPPDQPLIPPLPPPDPDPVPDPSPARKTPAKKAAPRKRAPKKALPK